MLRRGGDGKQPRTATFDNLSFTVDKGSGISTDTPSTFKAENTLSILPQGKQQTFGKFTGDFAGPFEPRKDGSTILICADGTSLAIDFSKSSGADALIVMARPGAGNAVDVGGTKISILPLTNGPTLQPEVRGKQVAIGGRTITYDGKTFSLAK